MARIVSDRADKTDQIVVLPVSLENSATLPPGTYRFGVFLACASIFAFFAALMVAYYWRSQTRDHWEPVQLPSILWLSTGLILSSSVTLEIGRHKFRHGHWRQASKLLMTTAAIGLAFVGCQLTGWWDLVQQGAYLVENPHASFFYIFTGLHAAHLIGGMIALAILVLGRRKRREWVDSATYYWHFLGVLWLLLFATLKFIS
jgi:cytochrome c oxidase subunit III